MLSTRSLALLFILDCVYLASSKITINKFDVPKSVNSKDKNSVILDCDFEVNKDKNVELKWYYQNDSNVIYQWIPARKIPPQVVNGSMFEGKIDTSYKISNDENYAQRALFIKEISPELSGNYTCKVSGDETEDVKTAKMTIYEPATYFNLIYENQKNVIGCEAVGIKGHKPEIILDINYITDSNDSLPSVKEVSHKVDGNDQFGYYNITKLFQIEEKALRHTTKFECVLFIPDTEYEVRKHITLSELFGPSYLGNDGGNKGSSLKNCFSIFWITCLAILQHIK